MAFQKIYKMRQKNIIPAITEKDRKRFWSKVSINDNKEVCWEWQRGKSVIGGYGNFDLRGKTFRAHRIAFFMGNGADPKDLCVCHKCDNPACVNPNHLFLGTDKDNVHDMHKKGRFSVRRGEENNLSKLKEGQVKEILEKHKNGQSASSLCKEYNVSSTVIYSIVNRITWKYLSEGYDKRKLEYGNSKLNKSKVIEIREKFSKGGKTMKELAILFNVTVTSICYIVNRKTWKCI